MNPKINVISAKTVIGGVVESFAPGEVISDPDVQSAIIMAGGLLVPLSPSLTAAATLAASFRARGDSRSAETVMLEALASTRGMPEVQTETLTGPDASCSLTFDLPAGVVFAVSLVVVGQVLTVGTGGIESVGDVYSVAASLTTKMVSGAIVIVPNAQGVPQVDADPSMSDVSVGVLPSGSQLQLSLKTGAKIGAGCQVQLTATVTAHATG